MAIKSSSVCALEPEKIAKTKWRLTYGTPCIMANVLLCNLPDCRIASAGWCGEGEKGDWWPGDWRRGSWIQITSWLEEGVATPPAPPEIDWEIQVQYSKHILQLNNIISHGLLLHKYKIFNELLPLALPSPIQRWISSNLLNWTQ